MAFQKRNEMVYDHIISFGGWVQKPTSGKIPVRFNEVTKVFVQQKEEAFDTLSQHKISLQSQKSIDQLLDREPGFFMKRYGNGMLSSISYRGTNAAQSSLEWNGVAIQSPNTGQNDLVDHQYAIRKTTNHTQQIDTDRGINQYFTSIFRKRRSRCKCRIQHTIHSSHRRLASIFQCAKIG
jgi:hypothetical protein